MWYVMRAVPEHEREAAALLGTVVDHRLWNQYRILKKERLLRLRGQYVSNEYDLFPGYLFIETNHKEELAEELQRARAFPKLIGNGTKELVAVELEDLKFLQNVCGEELGNVMGLSTVEADEEGNICKVQGILEPYLEQVRKQRFRKRFVVVKVPLFHRMQDILFGIRTKQDVIISNIEGR